jgi:hypothetical protein
MNSPSSLMSLYHHSSLPFSKKPWFHSHSIILFFPLSPFASSAHSAEEKNNNHPSGSGSGSEEEESFTCSTRSGTPPWGSSSHSDAEQKWLSDMRLQIRQLFYPVFPTGAYTYIQGLGRVFFLSFFPSPSFLFSFFLSFFFSSYLLLFLFLFLLLLLLFFLLVFLPLPHLFTFNRGVTDYWTGTDSEVVFHQEVNFLYLTGIVEPDFEVLINHGAQTTTLIAPRRFPSFSFLSPSLLVSPFLFFVSRFSLPSRFYVFLMSFIPCS